LAWIGWLVAAALAGTAVAAEPQVPAGAAADAAALERYVGDFQLAPTAVMSITRDGTRLYAQITGQPKLEIFARGEGDFVYEAVEARLSFELDAEGRATGLVLHQNGKAVPAPRIDPIVAEHIAATIRTKIEGQTPTPGGEAALRRLIAGIASGTPDYQELSPELAGAVRRQLPRLQPSLSHLGAGQSIDFRGIGNQGWDLYDVKHEHGTSQWRISLGADGILAGALVSAGP